MTLQITLLKKKSSKEEKIVFRAFQTTFASSSPVFSIREIDVLLSQC